MLWWDTQVYLNPTPFLWFQVSGNLADVSFKIQGHVNHVFGLQFMVYFKASKILV